MSGRAAASERTIPRPRETTALFGHREAEQSLLNAYRSGRIPHAWLIGGAEGIGKATLAYRMARFVLAHDDPRLPEVQAAATLEVDPTNPVVRHVAADSHGGLLTLERTPNEKGVMRTVISVEQTRETIGFFGSTAAAGWRVCIVDTVDELNPNAANALLKVLEEPPRQSLFLLVSRSPARVLPTIQSRCRKLLLRSLSVDDVTQAAALAAQVNPTDAELAEVAAAAEGSVSRALMLFGGDALKLQRSTATMLNALPHVDPRELHALGDALGGSDRTELGAFIDSIDRWIASQLQIGDDARANAELPRLARLAEVWEKIARAARETETYNLERKPLVFSVFGLLAEATR